MGVVATVQAGARVARIGFAAWQAARPQGAPVADSAAQVLARGHLGRVLAGSRGLPAKIGQWLSTGSAGEDLAACREDAPPVPWETCERTLSRAWGRPVAEVLAEVDRQGRAASLGQVHRARLHDGRQVAVKVRHPGIREAVRGELDLLARLPRPPAMRRAGVDVAGHLRVLATALEDELDYTREAATQRAYTTDSGIVVPRVMDALVRDDVLVQSWEDGATADAARAWDPVDRDRCGGLLLRHVMGRLCNGDLWHGDLHPGNLRLRRGPAAVVLYDFGAVVRVEAETVLVWRRMIEELRSGRDERVFERLVEAGFEPDRLLPIRDRVGELMRLLCAPLLQAGSFQCAGWRPGDRIEVLLADARWAFRAAGPAHLFAPLRAWGALQRLMARIDARVDWAGAFDVAMAAQPVPPSVASRLRMLIEDDGTEVVRVELPAEAIDRVETLLDAALIQRLRGRGIDIAAIAGAARASGLLPGVLFSDDRLHQGRRRLVLVSLVA